MEHPRPGLAGLGFDRLQALGLLRLQDHLLAGAGHIDGQSLAAQTPGQQVGPRDVFGRRVLGEIDRLGDAVVDKGLDGGLHAHVFLGGDVVGDHKDVRHVFRNLVDFLTAAGLGYLPDDAVAEIGAQSRAFQRAHEQGTGVGEIDFVVTILEMTDVGQGKGRLAAIGLTTGDGGDGAGGRHGGLRRVADAIGPDPLHDLVPV